MKLTSLLPRARQALALGAVAVLPALFAAEQPAASAQAPAAAPEVREPSRSYTDGGRTNIRVRDDYIAPFGISPFYDPRGPFHSGFSTTVTVQRTQIFLPPVPPALGEPVPTTKANVTLAAVALPPVLRSFVYETFYAPLSALMFTEDLSRKRRDKLDAYLAARTQAVAALHARLESLASAAPDTRAQTLADFARQQAAPLAELENTADELRSNFVSGSWLQTGVDWDDMRQWRLGDDTRWESALDEIKVVVGASFFQEGLSSAQRLLLRELAMELADSLRAPDEDIALSAPGPFLYFSPFTARIRLPAGLPADLEAKIDAYRVKKSALKRELRDELYRRDRAFFASTRTNALKALATKQAPEFAVVEQLAEEIRVGLAPFPNPAAPTALPLPPALAQRVAAYLTVKSTWQKAMLEKVAELRAQFPDDRVEFTRLDGRPGVQLVGNRRAKADTNLKRETAQAALGVFNAQQQKTYDGLAREKELLRTEILQLASAAAGRQTTKSIEQLLQEFTHSLGQQELWLRYADYETAVLLPGLSPEQRRLLFSAALEKLELPLLNH